VNEKNSRLWLAIRCTDLSLSALKFSASEFADAFARPAVVIEKKSVVFANTLAEQAGVCLGMDTTTAQLLSDCHVFERDKTCEQKALHKLAEQLYQLTPHIEQYCSPFTAESGLLLEVSSCLMLFSGLQSLTDAITHSLQQTDHAFVFGLAHSAKAAWLLSFADYAITGNETRDVFIERLNQLPINLLIDYPSAMDSLAKTGFRCFGDIAEQILHKSLSSFKKRFGREFIELLCDIYDIDQHFQQNSLFQKPRGTYTPDEWFEQEIQFEYPVLLVDQLKPAIEWLLQQLCEYLRKRQQQAQYIEWVIADIYRRKELLQVNSDEPQSHWQLLYDLSLIQFENKELPFEVDTIRLICRNTQELQNRNQLLDYNQSRKRKTSVQDFAVTIAKLKARLGDAAVYKLSYQDNRVPELTNKKIALSEKSNQELPDIHHPALRPTWLLPKPELIEERNNRLFWHGYLSLVNGPERIIGNWWDEPVARDYYLARRQDHAHLWIFLNLYDKKWYAQGVFS
jgi:protein ImuB